MTRIPSSSRVTRAFRAVKKELRASLKHVHQNAAKLLAAGKYGPAQSLVDLAQAVRSFEGEVDVLARKWGSLQNGPGKPAGGDVTPLWEYYRIILSALVETDRRLSTPNLIKVLEPMVGSALKPTDLELASSGKPRWQGMVRKARRHMAKEGFIEAATGSEWRITSAGRKIAEQKTAK